MTLAGRDYARVYDASGRDDLHAFLVSAVEASGGRVLYASPAARAPIFLGVQGSRGERIGLLVYLFRMSRIATRNRPRDENKGQIRYGSETGWASDDHVVGQDIAGVDTTLVLGVHLEDGLLVGLDPCLYNPLPMGISFYAKDSHLDAARHDGWHVWERVNRIGKVRAAPRAQRGLETMVAFRPERLLDYARFERQASDLGLDQPLRFTAAQRVIGGSSETSEPDLAVGTLHDLERQFELSSQDILEIISTRNRLEVAVRGGVAEHHLERLLRADPQVAAVQRLDLDAQPDFEVELTDGRRVRVECKNASPEPYASGDFKVEVQKTRASKGDPASRYYRPDQFDVVAACMYPPTGMWTFRYRSTTELVAHDQHPDRIASIQRIKAHWATSLVDAL